jgi:hypothetical protein
MSGHRRTVDVDEEVGVRVTCVHGRSLMTGESGAGGGYMVPGLGDVLGQDIGAAWGTIDGMMGVVGVQGMRLGM